MMLTTEQVKQIAEYMWPDSKVTIEKQWPDFPVRIYHGGSSESLFDPNTDSDNHKVFKALVDECNKRDIEITIRWRHITITKIYGHRDESSVLFQDEFINESICLAYLKVMESK